MSKICKKDVLTLAWLLLFGFLYNRAVAEVEKKGYDRGFTSLMVVGGTLGTVILGGPMIGWDRVSRVLMAFSASGLSMVLGSWQRHVTAREADVLAGHQIAREILHGQQKGEASS